MCICCTTTATSEAHSINTPPVCDSQSRYLCPTAYKYICVSRLSVIRALEADPTDTHHLHGNDRCMFSNMYDERLKCFCNVQMNATPLKGDEARLHHWTQIRACYHETQLNRLRSVRAAARGERNTRDEPQVWILMRAGLELNLGYADLLQHGL